MEWLDRDTTLARLDYQAVANACAEQLHLAHAGRTHCPPRGVLPLAEDGTLLLMPAGDDDIAITKLVTVHPHNTHQALPTIQGEMVVLEAATGRRLLVADGAAVSARRTAAVSLLAAQHLAPRTDTPVLVYGAGTQAQVHLEALHEGLGVREAYLFSRTRQRAEALAQTMTARGMQVQVVAAPEAVLDRVRLIVTATTATTPFLPERLPEDCFVAAVGAFRAHMAEAPPALVANSRVVIDTDEGARAEAGDLIQAATQNAFHWSDAITLDAVVREGKTPAGSGPVLFKSVGQSLWDLAAGRVLAATLDNG